jgi:uncharacterized protein YvpB
MANNYTWRQLIEATKIVAKQYEGENHKAWMRQVDAKAPTMLDQPYDGPAINDWADKLGLKKVMAIKAEIRKMTRQARQTKPAAQPPKSPVVSQKQTSAKGEVRLDVPFISQFDPGASGHSADCGPTCLAMIINAGEPKNKQVKVDDLYAKYLPKKGKSDVTNMNEMIAVGNGEGINADYKKFPNDRTRALKDLREMVDKGLPFVVLVNYAPWNAETKNNYELAHFVVVTGYDQDYVYVHDPLFSGDRRNWGKHYKWSNDTFLEGWASLDKIPGGNHNYSAVISSKIVPQLSA